MTLNTPEYRERLIQEGRFVEAYRAFREAAAADPQNANLMFNAGLGAFITGALPEAAAYWTKVKELVPQDLPIRAKLVQVYELLHDTARREAERAELHALYQLLKANPQTPAYYLRDQFEAGEFTVAVVEYFELTGPQAVRYKFLVHRGEAQTPEFALSLGSYDMTNDFAHHGGMVPSDKRLFHLDEYRSGGHSGLGFFVDEPAYDTVKTAMTEVLMRRTSPDALPHKYKYN